MIFLPKITAQSGVRARADQYRYDARKAHMDYLLDAENRYIVDMEGIDGWEADELASYEEN